MLLPYLDRYYIVKFLGTENLGIYSSVAELTIRSFSVLIFPITMALHPRITKFWNKDKRKYALGLINKSVFLFSILLLITLLIVSSFNDFIFLIINIIIPDIPISSKKIILPLILTGIMWQLSFLIHKIIELKEKTYLMILFIIFSLLTNLIGNNYFLPNYGIIATAYTSLASATIYCVFSFIYYLKSLNKIN